MGFMLGTAMGEDNGSKPTKWMTTHELRKAPVKPQYIYVEVTGSRIPQRVYVSGQQVNGSSPVYVVQGAELNRTGATSVLGMLALDPSISVGRKH